MQTYIGYGCIFLAAVCWAFLGPAGRVAMDAGLTPLEVAFWRAAFGCVLFLLHAARTRTLKPRSAIDLGAIGLFGLVSLASLFVCYQYAVQNGGAALASVLLYTAPAWVAVFSRMIFGETLTPAKLAAIAMALAGVACISFSGTGASALPAAGDGSGPAFPLAGLFFGLLSGLLYSTMYIFTKSYLKRYTTYTLYGWSMAFASLGLLPFVSRLPATPVAWAAVLFIALVCTYAGFWAYGEGMKRLSPTKAAVLCTLEPFVATGAAWWLWGERFTGMGWVGAILIISAVLALILAPHKETADE